MRGRLGFFVGFGAGYVLGSKAGHDRYEQLKRLYENLLASPSFRDATDKAKDVVGTGFEQAREKAAEGVTKVQEVVKDRRTGESNHPSGLSVAPRPNP